MPKRAINATIFLRKGGQKGGKPFKKRWKLFRLKPATDKGFRFSTSDPPLKPHSKKVENLKTQHLWLKIISESCSGFINLSSIKRGKPHCIYALLSSRKDGTCQPDISLPPPVGMVKKVR
jgi:hypothetical protein